jgi:hypothetical protein
MNVLIGIDLDQAAWETERLVQFGRSDAIDMWRALIPEDGRLPPLIRDAI